MLIDSSNLQQAEKVFEALMDHALTREPIGGMESLFRTYNGANGKAIEVTMRGALPVFEQWLDERPTSGFRALKKTMPLKTYATKLVELFRKDIEYDMTGNVADALSALAAQTAYLNEKLVLDAIDGNATGIDGVALISASHPFGSSTTWDNSTSNSLSFSAWDTAQAYGASLQDEFGEYLNIKYDTLVVGTALKRTALEIMQAEDRPVSVSTAGALNGAAGATQLVNVFKGAGKVIVSPRIAANMWRAVDSRYAPVALCQWSPPKYSITPDDSDARMRRDIYLAGVQADVAAYGLQPWGIYGKIA